MIHVDIQPPPDDFEVKVAVKGQAFLAKNPNPSSWKNKEFWRDAIDDLRQAYNDICAYSCHWIPNDTGSSTVDHYFPKSIAPHLAYSWDNYRLASSRMNSRKREFLDVLDPFEIETGWFMLDFSTIHVKPLLDLDNVMLGKILRTIERLQLNDERLIKARLKWILDYCYGPLDFDYLKSHAPFIAFELERQSLQDKKLLQSIFPLRI